MIKFYNQMRDIINYLTIKNVAVIISGIVLLVFLSANSTKFSQAKNAGFLISSERIPIVIDLNDEKQIIENFGASDCWSTKFIGNWADKKKKDLIADYLFSKDTAANGQPKGIGLSLWRFNIGAGSFEQAEKSGISDEFRREECFLSPNGDYNWSKQKGQQWFLQAAKERGVKDFLAFSISPPVQFTISGKAYGLGTMHLNLKPQYQDDFADFLVKVVEHFNKNGYKMQYLSPFNEPQWNWGEKKASQEGTAATNTEISDFIKILAPKLKSANSPTTIALGEAAQWNFLNANSKESRDNQLYDFFDPKSANYIGNQPNMENMISAHSYFTTCPDSSLTNYRSEIVNQRNKINPNLRLWQSEFGILGNVCNQFKGAPRNTGIDYGLYVAKVIHHDLAIANVSAWHWWLAVNPYDYSDGLVYINDPSGGFNLQTMKTDGVVSDSKQLWCFGNYSRFVNPGMKRVSASLKTNRTNVPYITAYKDVKLKKVVIVLVNDNDTGYDLTIDQLNVKWASPKLKTYTTSANTNLAKSVVDASQVYVEPKSVLTLVGEYK